MIKTIKINISGLVFHIDEDAYDELQSYITSLKDHFSGQPEGDEIVSDIESRIAELFQEKITPGKESITFSDVRSVIAVLGTPRDFKIEEDQEEPKAEKKAEKENWKARPQKRLYRDPDNSYLGGVAGGLGAYFNIEPLWIRVIFVILTFINVLFLPSISIMGFGVFLYVILWVVVPKAVTTAQKLEMRGENVNLSNIEKSINHEYQQVKKNYEKFRRSESYKNTHNAINQFFQGIGYFLKGIIKIILFIVGFALIVSGIATILALVGFTFFDFNWLSYFTDIDFVSFRDFLGFITSGEDYTLLLISSFLAITIPLIALVYGGIKLLFPIKGNDKPFGLGMFVLWFLMVCLSVSLIFIEVQDFRKSESKALSYDVSPKKSDILYISINDEYESPRNYWSFFFFNNEDYRYAYKDGEKVIYGKPSFHIVSTDNEGYELTVENESRGINYDEAHFNLSQIEYDWVLRDSVLYIDPFFTVKPPAKWREPEVDLVLAVSDGKEIVFMENMDHYVPYVKSEEGHYTKNITGKILTMTDDGLIYKE